jgi:hypothetical protein
MEKKVFYFISMLCIAVVLIVLVTGSTTPADQQEVKAVSKTTPNEQQKASLGMMPANFEKQMEAARKFQTLFDSLPPMQKNMFLTNLKHIMDPEVPIIEPGKVDSDPPSDAIILFNGKDLNEWDEMGFGPNRTMTKKPAVTWVIKDGAIEASQSSGSLTTKRSFEDFQLHVEWRTPSVVTGEGQGRGNSGVIIQGNYEIQILDSYNNRTYKNGQAGAVYMQYAPLVNVSRKPGEWQSFDIIYTAPRFKNDSTFFTPPRVTIFHNGVLIQNNVEIQGPTVSPGIPQYIVKAHGPAPFTLQRHSGTLAFRNIWIREL